MIKVDINTDSEIVCQVDGLPHEIIAELMYGFRTIAEETGINLADFIQMIVETYVKSGDLSKTAKFILSDEAS